jgi:hypothetical protein
MRCTATTRSPATTGELYPVPIAARQSSDGPDAGQRVSTACAVELSCRGGRFPVRRPLRGSHDRLWDVIAAAIGEQPHLDERDQCGNGGGCSQQSAAPSPEAQAARTAGSTEFIG